MSRTRADTSSALGCQWTGTREGPRLEAMFRCRRSRSAAAGEGKRTSTVDVGRRVRRGHWLLSHGGQYQWVRLRCGLAKTMIEPRFLSVRAARLVPMPDSSSRVGETSTSCSFNRARTRDCGWCGWASEAPALLEAGPSNQPISQRAASCSVGISFTTALHCRSKGRNIRNRKRPVHFAKKMDGCWRYRYLVTAQSLPVPCNSWK